MRDINMRERGDRRRDAAGMVDDKDVVLAVLGASAGLAGLTLVFLGIAMSRLQSYGSEAPHGLLRPLRILATVTAIGFLAGLTCVSDCVWWLVGNQQRGAYVGSLVVFALQLIVLAAVAGASLIAFIWTDAGRSIAIDNDAAATTGAGPL